MDDVRANIPAEDWRWYGNAAHFICGRWCRFHLATEIGGFVVSTVGEYVPPSAGINEVEEDEWFQENFPGKDIGINRKYETMVFRKDAGRCECGCGLPKIIPQELDADGYQNATDATEGHMRFCKKWASPARFTEVDDVN